VDGSLDTGGGGEGRPRVPVPDSEALERSASADLLGGRTVPAASDPPAARLREEPADTTLPAAEAPTPLSPLREPEFARSVVARIKADDRAAGSILFNESRRGIRRVLRRFGLPEWDIAELTHDAFETAIEKIKRGELRDAAALGSFVCGIARGKAHNLRRRRDRHPTTGDPAQLDALAAEGEGPDGSVGRVQDKEIVWQVLDAMRPRDREVLIHFILHDEDKDEVCATLGIPSARFHGILCRAKQRFHKLLMTTAAGREMERRR
jgi:RNA polymerase sigma factor (sigma-70 family)